MDGPTANAASSFVISGRTGLTGHAWEQTAVHPEATPSAAPETNCANHFTAPDKGISKQPEGQEVPLTRVSLIVLNYEGKAVLSDCLTSLKAVASPDDEIIVVDNASTDGSAADAERRGLADKFLNLPTNTYIFGLNEGLKIADGEYVAFLNNDIVVEPNFVDNALKYFSEDVFAVCPRILQDGAEQGSRTSGKWSRGLLFYTPLPHSESPTECFFAVGGQSFFCRSMLLEIGSIDPLLWPMYHEDIELSYRAWKRGWRILYAPDSVVHHIGGYSSKRVFSRTQLRSFVRQNEYLTVWKNVTDWRLLLEHLVLLGPRLVAAALKGDTGTLVGFMHAFARLRHALRAREEAKKHFRMGDREVLAKVDSIV